MFIGIVRGSCEGGGAGVGYLVGQDGEGSGKREEGSVFCSWRNSFDRFVNLDI